MIFYHQNEIRGLLCSFIAPKATVVTLNAKFGVYIFCCGLFSCVFEVRCCVVVHADLEVLEIQACILCSDSFHHSIFQIRSIVCEPRDLL